MTCALSAICGTHLGETKAVASLTCRPASCRRWMSSTLTSVETGAASFCSPSRGPTSTSFTFRGIVMSKPVTNLPPRRHDSKIPENSFGLSWRLGVLVAICGGACGSGPRLRRRALFEDGGQLFLRLGGDADRGDALRHLLHRLVVDARVRHFRYQLLDGRDRVGPARTEAAEHAADALV